MTTKTAGNSGRNTSSGGAPEDDLDDIEDLVAQARTHCPIAWAALVKRFNRLLLTVCRSFGLSDPDAADVVQTVWLNLVAHIDSISEPGRIGTWLVTATRRECIKAVDRRRRQNPVDVATMEGGLGVIESFEDGLVDQDAGARLRAAVPHLPAGCRRLIEMLLVAPTPTYEEIATTLAIATNSVGPRRRRCLDLLQTIAGSPPPRAQARPA